MQGIYGYWGTVEGFTVFKTQATVSTNLDAKTLQIATDNTVFWALEQTGGRGRLERKWYSQKGGLYFSIVQKPGLPPDDLSFIPLLAGLSVRNVVYEEFSVPAMVKWPNDVLIGNQKICGILAEVTVTGAELTLVTGIGLNLINRVCLPGATSLERVTKGDIHPDVILDNILREFKKNYTLALSHGFTTIFRKINENIAFLGDPVVLESKISKDKDPVSGIFRGIDHRGRALIEIKDVGTVPFLSGDLSLRPKNKPPLKPGRT